MNWVLQLFGFTKEIIAARSDLKLAKINAEADIARSAGEREGAWETMAAQNAQNSFLDEWWTIILSVPLILAFIPQLQPFVEQGFANLEDVPDWYVWAILASISFAFARKNMPDLSAWRKRRE